MLQFNSLQAIRDRYRDLTAVTTGMNWDLIQKFIKVHLYTITLYIACTYIIYIKIEW